MGNHADMRVGRGAREAAAVQIVYTIVLLVNIVLALLLIVGVMFMQSKSEGMGGILGGTSNISSRGIKGIDEQYRGYIRRIAFAWLITVGIAAFLSGYVATGGY
ncbi:MAG: hypothetical protein GEEBNDBF_00397 [bacterium]|nr:hypothetical protein [bacterium]